MIITESQLRQSMPHVRATSVATYLPIFNDILPKHGINTSLRLAHFFAQIGHETASLLYVKEIASGKAYEGRKDLGNVNPGDGIKYKGRGLIQITGRNNYAAVSKWLFNNNKIIEQPQLLELPYYGTAASVWFWDIKRLNVEADKDDIRTITLRINGGLNGYRDRCDRLLSAKKAFNII